MSVQPDQSSGGQPADSEGRFSTLIGSLAAATSTDRAGEDEQAAQDDKADGRPATPPRPTFTARASGPATAVAPEPTDTPEPDSSGSRVRRAPALDAPTPAPVPPAPDDVPPAPAATAPTPEAPALPDEEETRALPRPAAAPAAAAMDGPLLDDVATLRARWQRVQASFVDGPHEAVGDAADLIEQTAQALVGALRQRQRQLRVEWESGAASASPDGERASREPDTEHLRLMMQHYRELFNQLCRQ